MLPADDRRMHVIGSLEGRHGVFRWGEGTRPQLQARPQFCSF
jgi:hypothetical protein